MVIDNTDFDRRNIKYFILPAINSNITSTKHNNHKVNDIYCKTLVNYLFGKAHLANISSTQGVDVPIITRPATVENPAISPISRLERGGLSVEVYSCVPSNATNNRPKIDNITFAGASWKAIDFIKPTGNIFFSHMAQKIRT